MGKLKNAEKKSRELHHPKESTPQSIVVHSGKISSNVHDLMMDFRKLVSPNTATNLRELSYNKLVDFISVANQLGLTHIFAFSQTENNIVFKIGRFPSGPSLHFKVTRYCLCKHLKASMSKYFESSSLYLAPPLVVLHNFNNMDSVQVKLMKATFQNMFPSINVRTVKISQCRRVALFHYNSESQTVELRHFAIRASPTGVSKNVKKLLQSHIPSLGQLEDVSQFVDGCDYGSDSENEELGDKVTLPDRFNGRGNAKSQQSSMKLVELGPRLSLELFKVERGAFEGEVIYHKYQVKTPEEASELQKKFERERLLKEQRKKEQEANVKRKLEKEQEAKVNKRSRIV